MLRIHQLIIKSIFLNMSLPIGQFKTENSSSFGEILHRSQRASSKNKNLKVGGIRSNQQGTTRSKHCASNNKKETTVKCFNRIFCVTTGSNIRVGTPVHQNNCKLLVGNRIPPFMN